MTSSFQTQRIAFFFIISAVIAFTVFVYSTTVSTHAQKESAMLRAEPLKVIPKIDLLDPLTQVLSMTAVQKRSVNSEDSSNNWALKAQNSSLEPCPVIPPGLKGPYKVDLQVSIWSTIESRYPWIQKGGHSQPENCLAQHRVAIIVPYRCREEHLKIFLNNLHDFGHRQQLDFMIMVVEPIANQTFNRAKLLNIGSLEALKMYPWECFVFHDVDLLPEDDRILYSCPVRPRHMSVAIDIYNYTLVFETYFGGVTAKTVDQMWAMNGFSNDFWGWGGEDDDAFKRVHLAGLNYTRYPESIARYKMHKHKHAADKGNSENECRYPILKETESRWKSSGWGNIKYRIEEKKRYPLYTHLVVDMFEEESREEVMKHVNCTAT